MRKLWDWTDRHPLAVFIIMFSVRDVVFGTSIALSDPLYANSNLVLNLQVWHAVHAFGIGMVALGMASMIGAVKDYRRVVSWSMGARAYGWAFAVMSLLVAGAFSVALLYFICYLASTAYGGYRYKWIRLTGIASNPRGVYERKGDHEGRN